MKRVIKFYRTETNKCYIEEFMDSLNDKVAQKILAVFKIIESDEIVSSKFFKKLTGIDIWECRIIWKSDIYRILGFFDKNNFVVLTNGFQKKKQKTPRNEIENAIKYMNDYKRRSK